MVDVLATLGCITSGYAVFYREDVALASSLDLLVLDYRMGGVVIIRVGLTVIRLAMEDCSGTRIVSLYVRAR